MALVSATPAAGGSGNPVLDEILAARATLSPAAQRAVGIASAAGAAPPPPVAPLPFARPVIGKALGGAPAPGPEPTAPIAMPPAPMPGLPAAPAPVVGAPRGTVEGDQARRTDLLSRPAALESVYGDIAHSSFGKAHPLLGKVIGGAAQIPSTLADIALSGVAPRIGAVVPGTSVNRGLTIGAENRQIAQEESERSAAAARAAEQPRAALETAQAQALLNPPAKTPEEEFLRDYRAAHEGASDEDALRAYTEATTKAASTPYADWKKANPNGTVEDWLKANAEAHPKNIEAKTLQLPDGSQVAGKADSQGNLLLEDGKPAPPGTKLYQQPNYGQLVLPTKTQEITDPATGIPTVMGWDEKTQRYDIPQGVAGAGPYAHQVQSAAALERMVNTNLIPLLAKMSKAGENGPVTGRFQDWLNRDIGNAKPDVAQFHQLMNGVTSMLMGMYGFRRQQAADYMAQQLGARMTPEAMSASLTAISQHAQSIIGGALEPAAGGNPPPATIRALDPQGKPFEAPAGSPLPKGWKLDNAAK